MTDTDKETSERGSVQNARLEVGRRLVELEKKINSVADYISEDADGHTPVHKAQALSDRELLTFIAWGVNRPAIRDEYERRQAHHRELARWFASRGEVDFVPVLAERVKQS